MRTPAPSRRRTLRPAMTPRPATTLRPATTRAARPSAPRQITPGSLQSGPLASSFGTPMGGDGAQEGPLGALGGSSFRSEVSQTAQHGVIVPPPASLGEESRLPIFESVESDWFRRGRHGTDHPARTGTRGGQYHHHHRQRLDFTGGRGLGSRGSGARAGLGRHDRRGPAQARAQGEPGPRRRGRRHRSRRADAIPVGVADKGAPGQLPTRYPSGAGRRARRRHSNDGGGGDALWDALYDALCDAVLV